MVFSNFFVPSQDRKAYLITLIDETTTTECRQEVAINLVKLFLGQGLAKELLDLLIKLELDKTGTSHGAATFGI